MRDSSIRKLHFQFTYEVSHKNPEKSWAKSTTPRCSTKDINASLGDQFVQYMNLDNVESYPEMLPHSPYNVLFTQNERIFPRWMLANAVERSQKVTYLVRPLCDMALSLLKERVY